MKPRDYETEGDTPKSRAGFPIPKGKEKRPDYYWAKKQPYKKKPGGGKLTYGPPEGQKFSGGKPLFVDAKGGRKGSPSVNHRPYVLMNEVSGRNKARHAAIERRLAKKGKGS